MVLCEVELSQAKESFIEQWGTLCIQWGGNKAMGQIHAFLLLQEEPTGTEDIMAALNMSRGNVSMNVRELIDWGLVHRRSVAGDRRDYYQAERDMQLVAMYVARERKKRELDPLIRLIHELEKVKGHPRNKELLRFKNTLHDILEMARKADGLLSALMILHPGKWLSWMKKPMK